MERSDKTARMMYDELNRSPLANRYGFGAKPMLINVDLQNAHTAVGRYVTAYENDPNQMDYVNRLAALGRAQNFPVVWTYVAFVGSGEDCGVFGACAPPRFSAGAGRWRQSPLGAAFRLARARGLQNGDGAAIVTGAAPDLRREEIPAHGVMRIGMTASPARKVHALCGRLSGARADPFGALVCKTWDADPRGAAGFRGLPWGVGDAEAAGLDSAEWRVVRIEDEEGPIAIPAAAGASPAVAAVKFRRCTVLYHGSPRGALETLVRLGADPQSLGAELAVQNEVRVAQAGAFGVAVAGLGGHARAGAHGHAFAQTTEGGALAVAIAGPRGVARLEGEGGLAIVDSFGLAAAQETGMAIARGVGAKACTGEGGMAIAMGPARWLIAGNGAMALALRRVGFIDIGADAIGIALNAKEGRTAIRGHHGARFILGLRSEPDGAPHFVVGRVGPGGLEPKTFYVWSDGEFRQAADMAERVSESFVGPDPEWEGFKAPTAPASPSEPETPAARTFGDDTIVLCPHQEAWPLAGPIPFADPPPLPILGLAWGEGSPAEAGFQSYPARWALVRVAHPSPIGAPAHSGAVSFETGEIIDSGSLSELVAILQRFGGARQRVGRVIPGANGAIVHAEDFGVASAPPSGWAFAGWRGEASAGEHGFARVGCNGVAVCGEAGVAIADEEGRAEAQAHGVAVSEGKRYGAAQAGYGGVAIGLERYKIAEAGDHGAAVARLGIARAGRHGVAFGDTAHAGRGGVAIGTGRISGETGALLVAYPSFHNAIVGQDGIEPGRQYVLRNGQFLRADEQGRDEDPLAE